ncbi:hypothetical protein ES707_21823 [subsurface metagenome]
MAKKRDTYKYRYIVKRRVRHSGITDNLERREKEHQRKWPSGHIRKVGYVTTEEAARKWEDKQKKA